jgi:hypothetical protein
MAALRGGEKAAHPTFKVDFFQPRFERNDPSTFLGGHLQGKEPLLARILKGL